MLALAVLVLLMQSPAPAGPPPEPAVASRPATPAPIVEVLELRPIRTVVPWRHEWHADKPEVSEGWIVVLRVAPELARPRQTEQPILMADAMPLEVVNLGYPAGTLVAVLPRRAADEPGAAERTFHFAAPGLPELVDAEAGERHRRAAVAAGIGPRPADEIARAFAAGGEPQSVRARRDLDATFAALLRRHAPSETEIADALEGRVDPQPKSVPAGR